MNTAVNTVDDFLIWYKTACYELVPSFVFNGLICTAAIAGAVYLGNPFVVGLALIYAIYTTGFLAIHYQKRKRENPHRGHMLMKESIACRKASHILQQHSRDRGFLWGKLRLPSKALEKSFLVLGNVGSGKTLTFRMFQRDQLPLITPGSNRRALIYDSKQDCLKYLVGLHRAGLIQSPMYILNPFDKRHVAWDMSKDVNSLLADDFALHLVPVNDKAANPYFDTCARQIMSCVLQVLIDRAPGEWTFRHLLLVMRSLDRVLQITNLRTDTHEVIKTLLQQASEKSRGDVLATIVSTTRKYERIAACWDNNPKKISIKDWLNPASPAGSAILVMGNYELARSSIDLVNGLFLDFVAKFGLSLPDDSRRFNYLYMDEFAEAGRFSAFRNLVLRGRSKGFISVIGLQDPRALYSIYGHDDAHSFIEQSGNRAFLHMKSPGAAQWASDCFSQGVKSFDDLGDNSRFTATLPPQVFMKLPEADFHSAGLEGYYMSGSVGCWHSRYSPEELRALLPPMVDDYQAFVEIPSEQTVLRPWSEEDAKVFGVPFVKDTDASKSSKDDDPLSHLVKVER